jgi:Bacterial capsule synthesis protein PGA_cap
MLKHKFLFLNFLGPLSCLSFFNFLGYECRALAEFDPFKNRVPCLEDSSLRLQVFGDVLLSKQNTNYNLDLFENLSALLRWGHYNIVNLEGPMTQYDKKEYPSMPFSLKMPPITAEILKHVGVSHVTQSNNHTMDYGLIGVRETQKLLEKVGIVSAGFGQNSQEASKPMVLKYKNVSVAVFSFTTTYPQEAWASKTKSGVAAPSLSEMERLIAEAAFQYDFVVVSYHWGDELSPYPLAHQKARAHAALKAGAHFVYGHHAHIAQSIERVQDKVVAYNLGNFVFTSHSAKPTLGLTASVRFCKADPIQNTSKQVDVVFTPLDIYVPRTRFKTAPYTLNAFFKHAQVYLNPPLFDLKSSFYFPSQKNINTLEQWMSLSKSLSLDSRVKGEL